MSGKNELIVLTPESALPVPVLIAVAGAHAAHRFIQFFTANIHNRNTREANSRNINAFLVWCADEAHLQPDMIEPVAVAAYVEKLACSRSTPPPPCAAPNTSSRRAIPRKVGGTESWTLVGNSPRL